MVVGRLVRGGGGSVLLEGAQRPARVAGQFPCGPGLGMVRGKLAAAAPEDCRDRGGDGDEEDDEYQDSDEFHDSIVFPFQAKKQWQKCPI